LWALFIILWAISVVNDDKFNELSKSLSDAFSGEVLPGSNSVFGGGAGQGAISPILSTPLIAEPSAQELAEAAVVRVEGAAAAGSAAAHEQQSLEQLRGRVEALARQQGLEQKLSASIDERGLAIRILPDKTLFDPGQADLRADAAPVLEGIAELVGSIEGKNPVRVEGNTDSVPISTGRFRNNWELSTGRAVTVLSSLLTAGVEPERVSAAGYADQRPIATNDTRRGRALNRRVEIIVVRNIPAGGAGASADAPLIDTGISEPLVDIANETFGQPAEEGATP
ncbi:MAG: OmpA family protein, partial [Gaiellaceae bacterium]